MASKTTFAYSDAFGYPKWIESITDNLYTNKPAKKTVTAKRSRCQDELFLESLRLDGYNKSNRAFRFKEYSKNKLIENGPSIRWRHETALRGLTSSNTTKEQYAESTKNAKLFANFNRDFGKSVEVAIRSGDPSGLLTWLSNLLLFASERKFYGYRFPDIVYITSRFNKAHPARSILQCNRCEQYTELLSCRKSGRRVYCQECSANMAYCQRCEGLCESEHQVMSANGEFRRWCQNCAGRAFNWNDDHFLHENPMPAAGVGAYHSSQQYIHQIGRTIEGLCSVGFELEFAPIGNTREKRDALSAKLKKLSDIVAGVEEDGSIRHLLGAEIVTNFGSLDVVLAGADEISKILTGKAVSHSTNCCGLHVSLGRNTVDQWTLAKFVTFWNASRNRDFLKSFCRRWESGYCKPKSEKGKLTEQMSALRPPEHIINCHDRRELVNTQNRNRVEVRAFRGTTNGETIKRCISLCVWLMAYCYESEDKKMRYSGFLDWCKTAARARGRDIFTPACITEFAESKGFLGLDSPRKIILSK